MISASRSHWGILVVIGLLLVWSGCPGEVPEGGSGVNSGSISGSGKTPHVGFVTNQIASFWTIAEIGANKAGEEFDAKVEVRMPDERSAAVQQRILEELLTIGVDGIAISPVDPENQLDILKTVAENADLITQDSDAPNSPRLCYVGMSNYDAGRMCGELVKEALPDGGKIMIFVGQIETNNARLRRQGLIDEVLGRSHDPNRAPDPAEAELTEGNYTILGTRTDLGNASNAKAQAEDAIARYPDLAAMVGLFAYNPPEILGALKVAGKLGEIQVIGFDEDDVTLQAIEDGHCYGTIVQNPYEYGYQSVRILAALARGDKSVIPEDKFVDIPARKITKENVAEFWSELKELTGK